MATLSETALEIALGKIGVHEVGGDNRGPEVDEFLRSVHLAPGAPWCAAFVHWCFAQAAQQLGLRNPCPPTGASQELWRLTATMHDSNPRAGLVYVLSHGHGLGHVGIIAGADEAGGVTEVSGNTFEDRGGRAGNCVALHHGTPEVTHGGELLGFIDFELANQLPRIA